MPFLTHKILVDGGGNGGLQVCILEERESKSFNIFNQALEHARNLEALDCDWDIDNITHYFSEGGIEVGTDSEGCPCAAYKEKALGMTFVKFPLDAQIRSCDCIMDAITGTFDAIINRGTLVQIIETDDSGSGTLCYESRLMVNLDELRETGELEIEWEESCWLDTAGLLNELCTDLDYIFNYTRKDTPKTLSYLESFGPDILDEILGLVASMPEEKRRCISCDQHILQQALRRKRCGIRAN